MTTDYRQELMDTIQPFVKYYQQFPMGFSETDNLNDVNECQKIVNELMLSFDNCSTSEKKSIIKREVERFEKGKNAGTYGRYVARLIYLTKNKNPM